MSWSSAVFSGLTTKAAIASGLIGALVVGGPAVMAAHNLGYGKAAKEARTEREAFLDRERIALTREISLWTEVAAARQMQVKLIEWSELAWDVSDEARDKMRAQLQRHKNEARTSSQRAAEALKQLEEIQHVWKEVEVPRPVLEPFCVRDGQDACDPAAPAATRAGAGDSLAVREPAPADGGRVEK